MTLVVHLLLTAYDYSHLGEPLYSVYIWDLRVEKKQRQMRVKLEVVHSD